MINHHAVKLNVGACVFIAQASTLSTPWRDINFSAGVINARARDVFARASTLNVDVRVLITPSSTLNTQALELFARRVDLFARGQSRLARWRAWTAASVVSITRRWPDRRAAGKRCSAGRHHGGAVCVADVGGAIPSALSRRRAVSLMR